MVPADDVAAVSSQQLDAAQRVTNAVEHVTAAQHGVEAEAVVETEQVTEDRRLGVAIADHAEGAQLR
jgi:hypothetical protein